MTIKPTNQLTSPVEVGAILDRLNDWHAQLRQAQIKSRLHLRVPPPSEPELAGDLRRLGLRQAIDTVEATEQVRQGISEWLAAAPVVHLTFGAPLVPANRQVIVEWLRAQIHPDTLVQFRADGTIAAGFVLRTRNKIYNFTSNQALWQHRHSISESARRVR